MVGIEELVYAVCLWHKREDVWYIRECGGERIHMDEYEKFVWLFIGTGYNFDEYVHLAEIMGLGDCVRFLGRRNDVCALYKIMNVSVLASFFEGLPTVTIETQAAGTATVISDSILRIFREFCRMVVQSRGEPVRQCFAQRIL